MPAGRPSLYTIELTNEICARMASGRSLNTIVKDDDMPGMTTVFEWLGKYPQFAENYARAVERRTDLLAEQILEISDTPVEGIRTEETADGTTKIIREDMLGHRRLQVDARKWLAAKMAPKKYGDKLDLDHSGGLTVNVNR